MVLSQDNTCTDEDRKKKKTRIEEGKIILNTCISIYNKVYLLLKVNTAAPARSNPRFDAQRIGGCSYL